MPEAALRGALSRPRLIIAVVLLMLAAIAWALLFGRGAAAAPAMLHAHAGTMHLHGALHAWGPHELRLAFLMWLLMAVAMMLPSAAPAILAFADLAQAGRGDIPASSRVGIFVLGYLIAWWGFGALATVVEWALASAALRLSVIDASTRPLAGALLLGAGAYQFSTLKHLCLTQCRSPLGFFLAHWRDGLKGALELGLRHGLYCVGCCWALMALMLLAGAMSLGATAALAAVMLLEKIAPARWRFGHAVGVALVVAGSAFLVSGLIPGDRS